MKKEDFILGKEFTYNMSYLQYIPELNVIKNTYKGQSQDLEIRSIYDFYDKKPMEIYFLNCRLT